MVGQRDIQRLGDGIQLESVQIRQKEPGQRHRIQHCRFKRQPQNLRISVDKAHIEGGVVRHQDRILAELQKLRQNHVDLRIGKHHVVIDAGQLFDLKGNRYVRIDKGTESVRNHSVYHFDGTDLDNPVLFRAEARGLDIENHVSICKCLVFGIIHQQL